MKKTFVVVYERMDHFSSYLDKLYYTGKLNLSELQSFRGILSQIKSMFEKLRSMSFLGIFPRYVKKDINRLKTELTLMEYNVSLISMNSFCTF